MTSANNELLKSFRKIVREEIETEGKNIRDEVSSDVTSLKIKISNDINYLSDRVKNVEVGMNSLDKKVEEFEKKVFSEFRKVNKNIKDSVNFLDKENLKLRKRLESVEGELNITPPAAQL